MQSASGDSYYGVLATDLHRDLRQVHKLPDIVRKLDHVAARAQTTNMEVEVEVEMKDDLSGHRAYFLFFLSLNEETSLKQQQATKHNKNKT